MYSESLSIQGLILIRLDVFADERGCFMETFRQSEFEKHCGSYTFVQDNHSISAKNVLRGLHYQLKHPQGKLVRVTRGAVFDVAVDLRESSPTFGQWVGVTLSAENRDMLWIPPGFAHGFYALSEETELQYKCTDYYAQGDEYSIRWDDPELSIEWPVDAIPDLSKKDEQGLSFTEAPTFS